MNTAKNLKSNKENATNIVPMENKETLAHVVMNNTYELWGKRIASVPVELLELDHSYQRTETGNANKLAENWDDTACEFLLVSFRDNKFYVIDGQHRMIAARINGIKSLPCVILTGLTRSEEARRFSVQGMGRKVLTPNDTFKANIECGNTKYKEVYTDMEIKRICDKHNIKITLSNFNPMINPKKLRSISRARIIVNSSGSNCLEWILDTITSSNWEYCTDAYEKDILMLFKTYYTENIEDLDNARERLIAIMNAITPREFVANAITTFINHSKNSALKLYLSKITQ